MCFRLDPQTRRIIFEEVSKEKTHPVGTYQTLIMELLKHVFLPLFTAMDLQLVIRWLVQQDFTELFENWGRAAKDEPPMTNWEKHLMDTTGGTFLMLVINNIVAMTMGNDTHCVSALALHVVFIVVDITSYWGRKAPCGVPAPLWIFFGLAVAGLADHFMGPFIFKEKTA